MGLDSHRGDLEGRFRWFLQGGRLGLHIGALRNSGHQA